MLRALYLYAVTPQQGVRKVVKKDREIVEKNTEKDKSTNLSKLKREHLLGICSRIKNKETVDVTEIAELEQFIKSMKYGLNFEQHEEPVDRMLKTHVPVFKEFKDVLNNPDSSDCNFLLEGDNLHSLKLLEKTHKGRIDVCYIDPPYNTLNEDFAYGDKMLDENDGFKHSKWLSFIKERLVIARKLLSNNGVIFISIDEYEFAQLKLLCDEIFGEENFVENFIWVKNSTKNLSRTTSTNHEYILCYAKDIESVKRNDNLFRIEKAGLSEVKNILKKATEDGLSPAEAEQKLKKFYKAHPELKGISQYKRVNFGPNNSSAPKATGKAATYEVIHPIDGLPCICPASGWRYTWETMQQHIKNGLIEFYDNHNHVPQFKRYLDTVETEVQKSVIEDFKDGKKELIKIFGESPFGNPKPTTLLKTLLGCCNKNALVLDFFAGSGTTGQAVLDLNKEDGGNRHFILCTNNEVSSSKHLDYIHSKGYMKDVKTSVKSTQSKINKFFDDNPDVYKELMIDGKKDYESYGICQSVTYPRLNTVITGIRPDGTKYSDGIEANLRYFQTEMIDKNDEDLDDLLLDASLCLAELDCMSIIDDKTVCVAECDEDVEDIIDNATDELKVVFVADDVFFEDDEQEFFDRHNVTIKPIPDCYYREV